MEKINCPKCNRIFDSVVGFVSHINKTHGINSEQMYREMNGIAEDPCCLCGCGTKLKFFSFVLGYGRYKKWHGTDGSNFGKDAQKKSIESYKKNLASGKTVRKKKEKIIIQKACQCPSCSKSYDNFESLGKHWVRSHNLDTKQLYLKLHNLNENPLCKCGCGEATTFLNCAIGFREFIRGHAARIPGMNNWANNNLARENSLATRREMLEDGEWVPFVLNETGKRWNDGLTKETDERVAKMSTNILNDKDEIKRRSERMKTNRASGIVPNLKGKNHSMWKGGSSSLSVICGANTNFYNKWKYPNLVRAGFKCENCLLTKNENANKQNLEVHHDKERMADIIRKVAQLYGWFEYMENEKEINEDRTQELKESIAEAVAKYHFDNNVSGKVLCKECHKKVHGSYNF